MAITEPKYFPGVDGNPDNDDEPVGGAMDDAAELNPATANNVIFKPKISDVDNVYRGVVYREGQAGTLWQAGKMTNRGGCNPPGSSGFPTLFSTSASDTGKAWMTYKHGGEWIPGVEIQLAGMTPVTGLITMDEDSDVVLINQAGVPAGDLHLSVNSEKLGVCYGGAKGVSGISTLGELALATAQNAAISIDNRKEDPSSGIGAFSRATWWIGQDNALPIPGDELAAGDHFGYCVRVRFPAGMPKPWGGFLSVMPDLLGDPIEV